MSTSTQVAVIRTFVYRAIIIVVLVALSFQLWRLQVGQGQELRALADSNRFREVIEPAARGVIYDSAGRILARNRPTFAVIVVPADLPDDDEPLDAALDHLITLLVTPVEPVVEPTATITPTLIATSTPRPPNRTAAATAVVSSTVTPVAAEPAPPRLPLNFADLQTMPRAAAVTLIRDAVITARLGSAFRPITIVNQVPQDAAFLVKEMGHTLPGVQVQINAMREYLTGALTADLIGYLGPIPAEQAETYAAEGYGSQDWVGYAGLENSYEQELRGQVGYRQIQVDVAGREISTVGEPRQPVPGYNLHLTIDVQLQQAMEAALRRGLAAAGSPSGVAIAMNPQNGAILGMVSLPTYDNNLFADGITEKEYAVLSGDPTRPLLNHAISGIYPPGSTFKMVAASAGLEEGVITSRTRLQDNGIMWLPNKYYPNDISKAQPFYCWIQQYGRGHGAIDVTEALAESCDVFFYQVGGGLRDFEGLNVDRLARYANQFGYGEPSGIKLPGEHGGLVPSDQWKRLTYGEGWFTGDTYNMSIGQGFVLATPLQVVNATAAIANGGTLHQPQLVAQLTDSSGTVVEQMEPEIIRQIPISPVNMAVVREGMFGAVNWSQGTAPGARVAGVAVAGKTGTAEFWDPEIGYDAKGRLPTHAWFTAFAPYDNPEIAVVVFIYNGGEGSAVAVPVASEILHTYFDVPMPPGDPYLRLQPGD